MPAVGRIEANGPVDPDPARLSVVEVFELHALDRPVKHATFVPLARVPSVTRRVVGAPPKDETERGSERYSYAVPGDTGLL